jgi:hypothetical protein
MGSNGAKKGTKGARKLKPLAIGVQSRFGVLSRF